MMPWVVVAFPLVELLKFLDQVCLQSAEYVLTLVFTEASGKTSVALSAIAEAQKQGHKCCFVDVEHALDVEYARGMGVKVEELYITQPDCGEDALDIVDSLVRSGAMKLIVVDSVSALVPKQEVESDLTHEKIALQARLMSRSLRKLGPNVSNTGTILIFINQIRNKVGVMFGSPETTSGGHALKFYASCRLDTRKNSIVKNSANEPVGTNHTIKIVKNKVGAPFKSCTFSMRFGKGINRAGELIDLALVAGLIEMKGSHHYLLLSDEEDAIALGNGREKAIDTLQQDVKLMERLTEMLKREVQLSKTELPTTADGGVPVVSE
jgi:recombination protein RecA